MLRKIRRGKTQRGYGLTAVQ